MRKKIETQPKSEVVEEKDLRPFNLLGLFKIERKSDILAFVALLLSIVNAMIAYDFRLSTDARGR